MDCEDKLGAQSWQMCLRGDDRSGAHPLRQKENEEAEEIRRHIGYLNDSVSIDISVS